MKHLLVALSLMVGVSAHAGYGGDWKCETHPSEIGGKAVGMVHKGGYYKVYIWGATRNLFEAVYTVKSSSPTSNGYMNFLNKVSDQSSWKDMPQEIVMEVNNAFTGRAPISTWIALRFKQGHYGKSGAAFDKSDCGPISPEGAGIY